jgi:hypothetical protein
MRMRLLIRLLTACACARVQGQERLRIEDALVPASYNIAMPWLSESQIIVKAENVVDDCPRVCRSGKEHML